MASASAMASYVIVLVLGLALGTSVDGSQDGEMTSCVSFMQKRAVKIRTLEFSVGPQNDRQKKIVDMMRHTWKGYAKNCFGEDELHPLDGGCSNGWHLGLTLIDSMDTLFLMGLNKEFKAARGWVANRSALDFNEVGPVSMFETTIRVLGGLLSAHALTGDQVFLDRAHELGERMLPAFRNGHGPPTSEVDVERSQGVPSRDPQLAESTTLGLEFMTLAELTQQPKFAKAVNSVANMIHSKQKLHGLAGNNVDTVDGSLFGPYKLGAGGDSYYEYLLKQWLLTGKKNTNFLQDYQEAVAGIKQYLVKKTKGPLHLTYVAEMRGEDIERRMDHLVCFLPGTLALGAHHGVDVEGGKKPWHLDLAKELMRTCYEMYKANGHMLGPEIALFDTNGKEIFVQQQDAHDLLRPETIESLFYLYRLTGDTKYQDWGWQMAQAIEKYAKVKGGGYASLENILIQKPEKRDSMESFFSAETLKYLFLLFDDSRTQVPLDKFVFNTEAHPFRVMPGQPGGELDDLAENGVSVLRRMPNGELRVDTEPEA